MTKKVISKTEESIKIIKRSDDSDSRINPYWKEEEEAGEIPDPETGCVRRGLCCRNNPGWFAPGEVEKAAQFLGMSADEFARKYLIIDSIEISGIGKVEVFAPVKLDIFGKPALPPLSRVDDLYRILKGKCIFYDGSGCKIYPVRPIECRHYFCFNPPEKNLSHEEIARMWVSLTSQESK